MRKPLAKNAILKLKDTGRGYIIDSVLGTGANSIVYNAHWDDDLQLPHFVRIKELYPIKAVIKRDNNMRLIWEDNSEQETALFRFGKEYEKHQVLSNWQSTVNSTVQYQESLLYGNGTAYTVMDIDNGKPFSDVSDNNLHELFKTLLALAKVVALYHEKGMLLLDIKPENILVLPETRELVKLFDFDSVILEKSVTDTKNGISYSYEYAAPELRLGKRNRICKATDYYAIGSIAFSRIIKRFPNADDCLRFSDWDLSQNTLFYSMSPKSQRLIKVLFRKTLASDTNSRFSCDQELIDALQEIVQETMPGQCFLYSSKRAPLSFFVGREKDIKEIRDAFINNKNIVFLRGLGGIGKTELAKAYSKQYEHEYDTVCFGTYKTNTEALLLNSSFISFANVPSNGVTVEDVLKRLSQTDSHTLLIVDDYQYSESDSRFVDLLSLPCHILITTREQTKDLFGYEKTIYHCELGSLQPLEQWELFNLGYQGILTEAEKQEIGELFTLVDGHTMSIDLLAKNKQATGLSASELLLRYKTGGIHAISETKMRHIKDDRIKTETIEGFLRTLFDVSKLSHDAIQALSCLALVGDIHIDKQFLCKLSCSSLDALNLELINRDWVRYIPELDEISTHSIILQTVKDTINPSIMTIPGLGEYFQHIVFDYKYNWGIDYQIGVGDDNFRFIHNVIRNTDPSDNAAIQLLTHLYASLCEDYLDEEECCFGGTIFKRGCIGYLQELQAKHSYGAQTEYELSKCKLFQEVYFLENESDYWGIKEIDIDERIRRAGDALSKTVQLSLRCNGYDHPRDFLLPIAKRLDNIILHISLYHNEHKDAILEFCRLFLNMKDKLILNDAPISEFDLKVFQDLQENVDDPNCYNSDISQETIPSNNSQLEEEPSINEEYVRLLKKLGKTKNKTIPLLEIINKNYTVQQKTDFLDDLVGGFVYYLAYPRRQENRDILFDEQRAEERIELLHAARIAYAMLLSNMENCKTVFYLEDHEVPDDSIESSENEEYAFWQSSWDNCWHTTLLEESLLQIILHDETTADKCINEYQDYIKSVLFTQDKYKSEWFVDDCCEEMRFNYEVFLKLLHYLGEYNRFIDALSWIEEVDDKYLWKGLPLIRPSTNYYVIYCFAIDAAEKTNNRKVSLYYRKKLNERYKRQFHYSEDLTRFY